MSGDNHEIQVNGKAKEVKMTFGLLNQMCGMCGEPEDALMFGIHAELREEALRLMLSERDDQGRIVEDVNLFNTEVDANEVAELLDWAGAHVLDFFLNAAEKTKSTGESRKERLEALQPSSTGGED